MAAHFYEVSPSRSQIRPDKCDSCWGSNEDNTSGDVEEWSPELQSPGRAAGNPWLVTPAWGRREGLAWGVGIAGHVESWAAHFFLDLSLSSCRMGKG